MEKITLIMLKPRSKDTKIEEDLFNLLFDKDLKILYSKEIEVIREDLIKTQPLLSNGTFNKEELEKIFKYNVGISKVFLITGDDIFKKALDIKAQLRKKYCIQNATERVIPLFIHASTNLEEVYLDISTFIPGKLELLKLINKHTENITIAFEGGMGSGKSTICKMLLSTLKDSQYYPEAMEYLSIEKNQDVWKNSGTQKALDILLEAESLRKIDITKNSHNGVILLDRSYLTFAAFEFALNRQKNYKYILDSLKSSDPPVKPDVIIFLSVEHSERIERLKERKLSSDIFDNLLNESFNKSLENFFKFLSPVPVIFIDTTNKKLDEVLKDTVIAIGNQREKIIQNNLLISHI